MGNMSYCRYQNTLGDLQDCYEALQQAVEDGTDLHYDEKEARRRLVDLCKEIAEQGDDLIEEADELKKSRDACQHDKFQEGDATCSACGLSGDEIFLDPQTK